MIFFNLIESLISFLENKHSSIYLEWMDIDSQPRAVPANCEGLHFILIDGEPEP